MISKKYLFASALLMLFFIIISGCKNPAFLQNKEDDKTNFIFAIVNTSLPTCNELHAKEGKFSVERCVRFLTNESNRGLRELYNDCKTDMDCSTGGCSNEFCGATIEVDDLSSDCTWEEIFKCYRKTKCSCIDKHCGWKKTPEYAECLGQWG